MGKKGKNFILDNLKRKKIIIISVYSAVILLLLALAISRMLPEGSCNDAVMNQNELGVDCGGICPQACEIEAQELIIDNYGSVPAGVQGKYDFYAQITNPNAIFGSKKFEYLIEFKDAAGEPTATRQGSAYILPGERKYVIETNIESVPAISYDFKILNSQWVEFTHYEKPDLQVVNKNYNMISSGTGFSEATGLVKNESHFDFDTIKIHIMLKNEQGTVVALNSTQMRTVRAGESRDFRVFWPNSFPGSVRSVDTQPEVNIFESDSFMRSYYKTEKFQNYDNKSQPRNTF